MNASSLSLKEPSKMFMSTFRDIHMSGKIYLRCYGEEFGGKCEKLLSSPLSS
jgi:hypothetical protein